MQSKESMGGSNTDAIDGNIHPALICILVLRHSFHESDYQAMLISVMIGCDQLRLVLFELLCRQSRMLVSATRSLEASVA